MAYALKELPFTSCSHLDVIPVEGKVDLLKCKDCEEEMSLKFWSKIKRNHPKHLKPRQKQSRSRKQARI